MNSIVVVVVVVEVEVEETKKSEWQRETGAEIDKRDREY